MSIAERRELILALRGRAGPGAPNGALMRRAADALDEYVTAEERNQCRLLSGHSGVHSG